MDPEVAHLLPESELPPGFTYPPTFVRVVELGLLDLEPWQILTGELLMTRAGGLRARMPNRALVPFARRGDNDDVACWEAGHGEQVRVIHDFTTPDRADRETFTDFNAWLRQAIEDLIEFE